MKRPARAEVHQEDRRYRQGSTVGCLDRVGDCGCPRHPIRANRPFPMWHVALLNCAARGAPQQSNQLRTYQIDNG